MHFVITRATPMAKHSALSRRWQIGALALALGLSGIAAPTGADAAVTLSPCVPGQVISSGNCLLDVNGGGADITVIVTGSSGFLSANSSSLSFLDTADGTLNLIRLIAGQSVGAADFATVPQGANATGYAYGAAAGTAQWVSAGATGFAGFRIGTVGNYNYGWVELTRGSLTVGRIGYETTVGQSAFIPLDVPEPASLALVGTGLAGLAAMGRRRRAAASVAFAH